MKKLHTHVFSIVDDMGNVVAECKCRINKGFGTISNGDGTYRNIIFPEYANSLVAVIYDFKSHIKGQGTELCKYMEDRVSSMGADYIHLDAMIKNTDATSFWEKMGYTKLKEASHFTFSYNKKLSTQ